MKKQKEDFKLKGKIHLSPNLFVIISDKKIKFKNSEISSIKKEAEKIKNTKILNLVSNKDALFYFTDIQIYSKNNGFKKPSSLYFLTKTGLDEANIEDLTYQPDYNDCLDYGKINIKSSKIFITPLSKDKSEGGFHNKSYSFSFENGTYEFLDYSLLLDNDYEDKVYMMKKK